MSGDFTLEADITVNNDATAAFEDIGQSARQTQDAIGNLGGVVSDGSGSWEDHKAAVNSTWKEYRFANKEFQVNNQLAFEGTRLIGSVGHAALKLTHIFTAYNTLQTNIADAEENLNDKRDKATEAIARYGAGSKQAIKALKEQQKAQEKLDKTNQGAIAQYIGMSVAVGSLAGDAFRVAKEFSVLNKTIAARGGIGKVLGVGKSAAKVAEGVSPLSNVAGGAAGVGLSSLGGKIKSFAGSKVGQVLLPLAAGVGTYEYLTEDAGGKELNQLNPFTGLFNGLFALTHSREQTQQAFANQNLGAGNSGMTVGVVNVYPTGASSAEVMDAVRSYTKVGQRVTPPAT